MKIFMTVSLTLTVVIVAVFFILFIRTEKEKVPQQQTQIQQQKCISETALLGCERAGFEVERQLNRCERAFLICEEMNEELQEKLQKKKGEQNDDN